MERGQRREAAWLGAALVAACVSWSFAATARAAEAAADPSAGGSGAVQPLRVGLSPGYPPLAFEKNGKPAGIEVDLSQLLATELGITLQVFPMPFDKLIPTLTSGKVDVIMSGLSVTKERSKKVLFTRPFLRVGQMALVRADDVKRASDPAAMDVSGSEVGVKKGTTGEGWAGRNLKVAKIVPFPTVEEGTAALRAGKIDYFVHDAPTVWRLTGRFDDRDEALAGIYRPLTEEHLAWAVRRDAQGEALAERLNAALARLEASGKLQEVLDRWIPVTKVTVAGGDPLPSPAPATAR
ncbi:MAG: amino acid ABC transporter substrate-binding protein [Deltaproteobacteria bacterium]|nr:amino acid ABC transporter substrate-binding protein [Deltaproteobacteria bacterium]